MTRFSVSTFIAFSASALAAAAALLLLPASAGAQRSPLAEGEPCPSRMYSDRDELVCRCGRTEGDANVWGTDVYTDDSELCHAALHAGVITQAGGVVRVTRAPGRSSYAPSTRNGVSSSQYPAWGGSIVFDAPENVAKLLGGAPLCPVRYMDGPTAWSGDCRCLEVGTGPVWGTNPYTSDSQLCRAARHAGVIGASGGIVRVTAAPGQNSYPGGSRNGITTDSYGPWNASFSVSAP